MTLISILVATRERPNIFKRMCQSALDTSANPSDIEFVSYHDNDDGSVYEYIGNHKEIIGERIILSQTWNECYKIATGDLYMFLCDDFVFRTSDWDKRIKNEFDKSKDKILFVYCNDGNHGRRLGTVGCLHKNWVNTLGYFFPPYFSGNYPDTWINDIANRIGRKVYLPILVEHMHWNFGKGELDKTLMDKVERDKRDDNRGIYLSKSQERERDAELLNGFIDRCANGL